MIQFGGIFLCRVRELKQGFSTLLFPHHGGNECNPVWPESGLPRRNNIAFGVSDPKALDTKSVWTGWRISYHLLEEEIEIFVLFRSYK